MTVAGFFTLLAGIPSVALDTGTTTLVQTATEDAFRGRVLEALSALPSVAMLIGLMADGFAIDAAGTTLVLSLGAMM